MDLQMMHDEVECDEGLGLEPHCVTSNHPSVIPERNICIENEIISYENLTIPGMTIDQAFGSLDSALSFYDAWKADVIRSVPPERLLIFDVKAGWEPLCKFLGCEASPNFVPMAIPGMAIPGT